MQLTHVRQTDPMGCGVACIAMLTGRSYREVAELLPEWNRAKGTGYHTIFGLLNAHDLRYQMVFATDTLTNKPRSIWPPAETFADAHMVCVESPIGGHYVVWQADGSVLDPNRKGLFRLRDYGRVQHIIGVFYEAARTEAGDE